MSGVTGVHTTAAEAWEHRKGVCQDITHLAIGALRSVGIPARYVCGYLHPKPDAADRPDGRRRVARVGRVVLRRRGTASTRRTSIEIGDRHVTVGRGRDYNDVAPLRGVYAGPYGSKLFVTRGDHARGVTGAAGVPTVAGSPAASDSAAVTMRISTISQVKTNAKAMSSIAVSAQ